ncbi:MAG: Gfo/Idh/MocA family oxidoreductase [Planctomycetales bacterium]|nr:Gfo/Idh/MocA family oxidoreductase [Planctomycetales bacterium]
MDRRTFVSASTAALATTTMATGQTQAAPNDRITIAAIGVRGRGGSVLSAFASRPNVDVKYIVDVDESVRNNRAEQIQQRTGRKPQAINDFRDVLDDAEVDAIMLGTPTHWHAIPTIMACQAGKDVYVEKPDAHNIIEGQRMVAAAKRYKRVVQLGTQSRSGKHFHDAMKYISEGHIGRCLFAKAWESAKQGSIGKPTDSDPPAGVDYDMWLGPAPKRPFNKMRFHGNWRWFFDYGAGDLGNDGVHRLDVARWAFDTALAAQGEKPLGPVKSVSAHGGKCYFDDLQEWPDNLVCTYDFGEGRVMTYEMRIWTPYNMFDETEAAMVLGDNGYVVIGNESWRAFGPKHKLIRNETGGYDNTVAHVEDFLNCMQTRGKPAADLETVGHPSSLLCHLGNAAWLAGRTLRFDSENYRFIGDDDAQQFLSRPVYRKPWVLPDIG